MRTTRDNRIIVGGLDEDKPQAPLSNESIMKHGAILKKQLQELFPELPIEIDYAYCATFGEPLDNLPFIRKNHKKKSLLSTWLWR